MDFHEILSPKEGVKAIVWDLVIIGGVIKLYEYLKKWVQKRPVAWKKLWRARILNAVANVVLIATCSYFAAQVLWALSGHVADQLSSAIHRGSDFRLEIATIVTSNDGQRGHFVQFTGRIFNAGDPSVIRSWALVIKGVDHQNVVAQPVWEVEENPLIIIEAAGGQTKYESKDSLMRKTMEGTVGTGSQMQGHIIFRVTDVNNDWLHVPGTVYEISCRDAFDKVVLASLPIPVPSK